MSDIINDWVKDDTRNGHNYKFAVIDITEKTKVTESIINYLSTSLLGQFRDFERLKRMFKNEPKVKVVDYVKNRIFPSLDTSLGYNLRKLNYNVRQGDWGEVLTSCIALDLRKVNAPIKKLRYKLNKEKSLLGLDLLAFEEDDQKNLSKAILFESKTRITYKKEIGIEAYESLCKNSSQAFVDMLNYISTFYFERQQYDLSDKYDQLIKEPNSIQKDYHAFIIMDKNKWKSEILDWLNSQTLDFQNVYFNVFLIENMRDLVLETYKRTVKIAQEVIYD